jgi:hypothetical protein
MPRLLKSKAMLRSLSPLRTRLTADADGVGLSRFQLLANDASPTRSALVEVLLDVEASTSRRLGQSKVQKFAKLILRGRPQCLDTLRLTRPLPRHRLSADLVNSRARACACVCAYARIGVWQRRSGNFWAALGSGPRRPLTRPPMHPMHNKGIHPIWVMRLPSGEDRLVIITRVRGARRTHQSLWCAPGALDLTPEH